MTTEERVKLIEEAEVDTDTAVRFFKELLMTAAQAEDGAASGSVELTFNERPEELTEEAAASFCLACACITTPFGTFCKCVVPPGGDC